MLVRLRKAKRLARDTFRLTLELVDPERDDWAPGDCVVRVDLRDAPRHDARPRGPLAPAFDLYRLAPEAPPVAADARLLWEMARAVDAYVTRLFEAGLVCPFEPRARDEAPERSE